MAHHHRHYEAPAHHGLIIGLCLFLLLFLLPLFILPYAAAHWLGFLLFLLLSIALCAEELGWRRHLH